MKSRAGSGVLALVVVLGVAWGGEAWARPVRGAQVDLEEALDALEDAARVLEGMRGVRGKATLMRRLAEARERILDAMEELEYRGRWDRRRPGHPVEVLPRPMPMDGTRFAGLIQDLRNLSFSSEQLALIRDVARHQWFLTAQVRQVMGVFSFDSEKVEAAATLYPRVLDREDFYQVYADFTFDSDRQRLRERIEAMDRGAQAPPGR